MPSAQYHPCYSGLQVQGTANTPAARVLILHGFCGNVNAFGGGKQKFLTAQPEIFVISTKAGFRAIVYNEHELLRNG